MSLPYWDVMLGRWARWCNLQIDGGIGYPKECPMFRLAPRSGRYDIGDVATFNEDAQWVDDIVKRLPEHDRKTLREYYVVGGTTIEIAQRLGIARSTLNDRIRRIHNVMFGEANALA